MSVLIGCIVAVAAKNREMVSTMTLSCLLLLIAFGMGLVQSFRHGVEQPFLLPYSVFFLGNLIMIFMGGGIVRKNRSAAARRRSSA
jgi:Zn-dependent protease with chaperone function